jgi:hypothetical protein
MPGPAALIALAARLGIPKAASLTYKQLQKRIAKAQKQKKSKQTESEKGYRGQGSKRQQEKVIQRKKEDKPKVDLGIGSKQGSVFKTKIGKQYWKIVSNKDGTAFSLFKSKLKTSKGSGTSYIYKKISEHPNIKAAKIAIPN